MGQILQDVSLGAHQLSESNDLITISAQSFRHQAIGTHGLVSIIISPTRARPGGKRRESCVLEGAFGQGYSRVGVVPCREGCIDVSMLVNELPVVGRTRHATASAERAEHDSQVDPGNAHVDWKDFS